MPRIFAAAVLFVLCGSPALPQAEKAVAEVDPWAPLRLLEGTWEGAIDGPLGRGRGVRRYELVLDDSYVVMRHASVRPPQEKSPKGDYHRELAVYSFDRERGSIVLREFMVEGYVTRYVCEVEPKRFVCTSESVESGPGLRARLTVELEDRYAFTETFELGWPGKEMQRLFTNEWTRAPDLRD